MADTVFLCHNSADTEDVKELASHLKADGIEVWLDVWNLIAGEPFTPKIEEALEKCTAAAVFFGKSGYSPYQNQEIQELLDRGLKGLRVIPLLLPGAPESLITGFLRTRTRVQFKHSLEEEDPYRLLVSGIRGIAPGQLEATGKPSQPTPPLTKRSEDKQPYRGLLAFDVDDWECFFGRKRLTGEAVEAVEARLNAGLRFLCIVGASGSGKSSLARAGVVHSLLATHADWQRVVLEPGAAPLDMLAERMLKLTHPQVDAEAIKRQSDECLKDMGVVRRSVLGALGNDPGKCRLVLLVDQFEEIFTQSDDKKARDAFIGNLLCAAQDTSGMTVVLICVRADFYENCAQTELSEVLSKQQILVGPMRRDELREAIRGPAVQGGYDVEPELIATLVTECEEQPSPLPLLQIALQKLWLNRSPEGTLTLAEFEKNMSLEGMIDVHANEVYADLPAEQQASCLSLFLQLVEPLESGQYARKRVLMDSLLPEADPKDPTTFARIKQIQGLIGTLSGRRARLITLRNDGGRVTIEIAHEAIFRGWKKLAAMLDQNTEFLVWRKRLGFEIVDWRKSKGKTGFLNGVLLDRARGWLKERPEGHTAEDRKFINASRDRLWWKRGVAAAAVAFTILLVALGVQALRRTNAQLAVERTREFTQQLTKTQPRLAVLLAYDLLKHGAQRPAQELLQEAVQAAEKYPLIAHPGLKDFSLQEDGKALAVAAAEGIALRTSAGNRGPVWYGDNILSQQNIDASPNWIRVALSPGGEYIAATDQAGKIGIWHLEKGQPQAMKLPQLDAKISALAVVTDGHVAITTDKKEAIWFDSVQGKVDGKVSLPEQAGALAVSHDRSTIALGLLDRTVRFWKTDSTVLQNPVLQHDGATLNYVAYSNDGKILASSVAGGKAYVWRPDQPGSARKFPPQTSLQVYATALSEKGGQLATIVADVITIWDTSSGHELLRYGPQRDVLKLGTA